MSGISRAMQQYTHSNAIGRNQFNTDTRSMHRYEEKIKIQDIFASKYISRQSPCPTSSQNVHNHERHFTGNANINIQMQLDAANQT
jgi:hypothetical protein